MFPSGGRDAHSGEAYPNSQEKAGNEKERRPSGPCHACRVAWAMPRSMSLGSRAQQNAKRRPVRGPPCPRCDGRDRRDARRQGLRQDRPIERGWNAMARADTRCPPTAIGITSLPMTSCRRPDVSDRRRRQPASSTSEGSVASSGRRTSRRCASRRRRTRRCRSTSARAGAVDRYLVVSQFSIATDSRGVSLVKGEHATEPFASADAAGR